MTEQIVFGGGCFWCVEAVFQRLKGVVSVVSGYAGGEGKKPNYYAVAGGETGHAEVIQVIYDPGIISFDILLSVFFAFHDPTTLNRQGNDVGSQYRSSIFYTTPEQKEQTEKFIQKLEEEKTFANKIITEVEPLDTFYEAEGYHQNYYNNNADQPYCQFMIDPKIAKLRSKFSHLLKET